jgi:hypothetical protein
VVRRLRSKCQAPDTLNALPGAICDKASIPGTISSTTALLRVHSAIGALYLAVQAVLLHLLLRMRLFDAIKLRETV